MTQEYVLATDSCCDLPRALVDELEVLVLEFPFTLDGEQHFDDLGTSMPAAEFYARMRAGSAPTTAQVPMSEYLAAFSSAAADGIPLLFLSFSSGLSGTHDAALVARESVLGEFPAADIRVIDTLSASTAQAMLVLEGARRKLDGADIDELTAWVESGRRCLNGYFTLDTLAALRRGGRLSDVAALAGTMLDVKPVLRLSEEGELVVDRPVRGRKKSLRVLAEVFDARADETAHAMVTVAHADAAEDAQTLVGMLRERRDIAEVLELDVGPVIGSHTGPGMVSLVFWGPERDS